MGQFTCTPVFGFIFYGQNFVVYFIINNYVFQSFLVIFFFYLFFFFSFQPFYFSFRFFTFDFIFKNILVVLKNTLSTQGYPFFSLCYCIFFFIFLNNFLGLLPFNHAITSHISFTLTFGFSLLFGLVFSGFFFFGKNFFSIIIPKNVSKILFPFLLVIETISYIMRPFSLSIRLFANILAGHALLFIMLYASYVLSIGSLVYKIFFFSPFLVSYMVFLLEILVAFLQAYVFFVLIMLYLQDFLKFLPFFNFSSFFLEYYLGLLQQQEVNDKKWLSYGININITYVYFSFLKFYKPVAIEWYHDELWNPLFKKRWKERYETKFYIEFHEEFLEPIQRVRSTEDVQVFFN